jgi:hypothetical protein
MFNLIRTEKEVFEFGRKYYKTQFDVTAYDDYKLLLLRRLKNRYASVRVSAQGLEISGEEINCCNLIV